MVGQSERAAIEAGAKALHLRWALEGINDYTPSTDQPVSWESLSDEDRDEWRDWAATCLNAADWTVEAS